MKLLVAALVLIAALLMTGCSSSSPTAVAPLQTPIAVLNDLRTDDTSGRGSAPFTVEGGQLAFQGGVTFDSAGRHAFGMWLEPTPPAPLANARPITVTIRHDQGKRYTYVGQCSSIKAGEYVLQVRGTPATYDVSVYEGSAPPSAVSDGSAAGTE